MTANILQPIFQIQRIYLKDLSVEQPNSPAIFLDIQAPDVDLTVNIEMNGLEEGIFEVSVVATMTAKMKGQVAFLIEGKQAGIFEIRHVTPEQLDTLLAVACPKLLYPYLRANLADVITRGGFPPVHLADINFEASYQQRLETLRQKQQVAENIQDADNQKEENYTPPDVIH